MSRSHRRVSRPLLVVLAVTIALIGLFSFKRLNKSHAATASAVAPVPAATRTELVGRPVAPTAPAAAAPAKPEPHVDVLVTKTPTAAPVGSSAFVKPDQSGPQFASSSTRPAEAPGSSGQLAAHVIPAVSLSGQPMADAGSKKEAGDLPAARAILNAALHSGRFSSDEESTRAQLEDLNKTLVFSAKKFADDPYAPPYRVQSGERLSSIAAKHDVTWELLSRINGITPRLLRAGSTIKVINGPFHAVVSKSKFRMDLYLGSPGQADSMYVTSFPVGLGKDDSTPTGVWMVEPNNKIKHPRYYSPRGEGIIEADDPRNPLGGFWIGLNGTDGQAVGKTSYGIHGTIDPTSIGKQASMGCIRLRQEDIAVVYEMLIEGKSTVVVKS